MGFADAVGSDVSSFIVLAAAGDVCDDSGVGSVDRALETVTLAFVIPSIPVLTSRPARRASTWI